MCLDFGATGCVSCIMATDVAREPFHTRRVWLPKLIDHKHTRVTTARKAYPAHMDIIYMPLAAGRSRGIPRRRRDHALSFVKFCSHFSLLQDHHSFRTSDTPRQSPHHTVSRHTDTELTSSEGAARDGHIRRRHRPPGVGQVQLSLGSLATLVRVDRRWRQRRSAALVHHT